jgi:hypothetical protein
VRYNWTILAPDDNSYMSSHATATDVFNADQGYGEYRITLTVFDAAGNSGSDSIVVTVAPDREQPEDRSLRLELVLAVIGIVAIVIALVMVWLHRRR